MGDTPEKRAKVYQMQLVITDANTASLMTSFKSTDKQEIAQAYYDKFAPIVEKLGNQKFLCGENVSLPDFLMFENVEYMNKISDGAYAQKFPTLPAYADRVKNLPGMKEFYNSDRCIKNVWGRPEMAYKWL